MSNLSSVKSDNNEQQKAAHPLDSYTNLPKQKGSSEQEDSPFYKSSAPSITLPKGGGALKGIDEKFTVNAVNGTAGIEVPFPLSPGRSGFTPALSLQYNSGSGNSEFGLGWSFSLPSIQRKTDKQIPKYLDEGIDSDVFLLAGAEDLVPAYTDSGQLDERVVGGFRIKRFIPRIEGLYARIEFIKENNKPGSWWRITTRDNITTYYGLTSNGRINDPVTNEDSQEKTYKWLPQLVIDHKGNAQEFFYKEEDLADVPRVSHEANRLNGTAVFANKYLKSVSYCNASMLNLADTTLDNYKPISYLTPNSSLRYRMKLVLDYGEHNLLLPKPDDDTAIGAPSWKARKDPFSDYKPGFEMRTYRLCKRVLMFHSFDELNDGNDTLVRSLVFSYANDSTINTFEETDLLTSVTSIGHELDSTNNIYKSKSLPPLVFAYQQPLWDTSVKSVSNEDSVHAPQGLTGNYQWVDFWGEGIPGILTEQGNGWHYKTNLGNGHFTNAVTIAPKPSFVGLGQSLQWQDLDADGRRQVVINEPGINGYFELDDDQEWENFRAFEHIANIDRNSPYAKILDLDGDGKPDVLLANDTVWTWYKNEGTAGYDEGGRSLVSYDEDQGPRLLLNDDIQSIFLADINGDGLTDIVRVKNGEVCYWPNKGYGKFGPKVVMSNAPHFDLPEKFNPLYVTLADFTGTGAADILYMGKGVIKAWINKAGNVWSQPIDIGNFPSIDQFSKVAVLDFLGNGTSCIVWSSPLPMYAGQPMRYIDLANGNKPYLLNNYQNGMGKHVGITYKSSVYFYLKDKLAKTPWATRLPFPVHCIESITTTDEVSQTTYKQLYSYHHGYYDHEEREFRGFGRVDTKDVESAEIDPASTLDQYPVITKTWYHTGAWMREKTLIDQYKQEYFQPQNWIQPPNHVYYDSLLTSVEQREAFRALKGLPLRQEIYADDGTILSSKPYSVTCNSYVISQKQKLYDNKHASFFSYKEHTLTYNCERDVNDPRVLHEVTVRVDDFGNVKDAATIAYPRVTTGSVPADVQSAQSQTLISYTHTAYTTDVITNQYYRLRLPWEVVTYELHNAVKTTPLWTAIGLHDVFNSSQYPIRDFSEGPVDTQNLTQKMKRVISATRTIFCNSNEGVEPLAAGTNDALALPYQTYTLTESLILTNNYYGVGIIGTGMVTQAGYLRDDELVASIPGFTILMPNRAGRWLPSGKQQYDVAGFYLPVSFTDPWNNTTTVVYQDYLLPVLIADPLGNITRVTVYDWRFLQPVTIVDPNDAISNIAYDMLGVPAAVAIGGNAGEGDNLYSTNPDSADDKVSQAAFWEDPFNNALALLGNATWRCVYDMNVSPVAVAMIAREEHSSVNPESRTLIRISYTDGLGRLAMHKAQAESELNTEPPRWIGSGKTVYNNKGNAVMQYEPYFSDTHRYDDAKQASLAGVTALMHYDPLNRLTRTDLPDGSYTKTEWTAWKQTDWDANDTVLDNGVYSKWYNTHATSTDVADQNAAQKALHHANTPTTTHFDILARPCCTLQINRSPENWTNDEYYTFIELDIVGNRRSIKDPRGLTILKYRYNYLKTPITQQSADSGRQMMYADAAGLPYYTWDANNQRSRIDYDELRRPYRKVIRVLGADRIVELYFYGESQANPKTNYLRGRLYRTVDGGGRVTTPKYDFKGQLLESQRQFALLDNQRIFWTNLPPNNLFETTVYTTKHLYDALNRPTENTTPDGGRTNFTYDRGGNLATVTVNNVRGLTETIVSGISYNARMQRTRVKYGVVTATTVYTYDDKTFRVKRIRTTRHNDNQVLQELDYFYDAVGNITRQKDNAEQRTFIKSTTGPGPVCDYTYDALYRLVKATGREHKGNNSAPSAYDSDRSGFGSMPFNDPSLLRTYIQLYSYDKVGNMLQMEHQVSDIDRWTRYFTIATDSNRLLSSVVGSAGTPENYSYDTRGNLVGGMSHLNVMDYDDENHLLHIGKTDVDAYYQYDTQGQRVRKTIVKTGGIKEVRKYIGGWEVYEKTTTAGSTVTTNIKRETLHLTDGVQRVGVIDTPTVNNTGSSEAQLLRYQFGNHLSTALIELAGDGAIISYEEYYPFGSTSLQSGRSIAEVSLKRYRYTGKERDEESGLYYHGARYYAPWLARWCAVDALQGKMPSWSSYCYGFDNPIKWEDSTGNNPNEKTQTTAPVGSSGNPVVLSEAKVTATKLTPTPAADNTGHAATRMDPFVEGARPGMYVPDMGKQDAIAEDIYGRSLSGPQEKVNAQLRRTEREYINQIGENIASGPFGAGGYLIGGDKGSAIGAQIDAMSLAAFFLRGRGAAESVPEAKEPARNEARANEATEQRGTRFSLSKEKAAEINPAYRNGSINITKKTFGHTFVNHGQNATNFITNRAAAQKQASGQFLDDQAAARFILDNLYQLKQGSKDLAIPENFPARMINPDGTYGVPKYIRLVPGGKGVKTAYPTY